MRRSFLAKPLKAISRFHVDRSGATGIIFGLSFVPAMMMMGASLDYAQATRTRAVLQKALDAAVLAGAAAPGGPSVAAAQATFAANAPGAVNAAATFQTSGNNISATATARVQTAFMKIMGVNTLNLTAKGSANGGYVSSSGGACIVALGNGLSKTNSAFTLNGAPVMNLSGCDVYSNTSMTCNGHGGGAANSFAFGNVTACANPQPNVGKWSDPNNLAKRAANISTVCGGVLSGMTWTAGTNPAGSALVGPIATDAGQEYHICGDLTLTGSGNLLPASTGDTLIVIENGNLNIASKANVTALSATFVLTGDNAHNHHVNFPNGKGQLATLTVEAPTDNDTPWRGVAIYVDPALTNGVAATWGVFDDDWGPGSNLVFDGVVYMPYTDLTLNGNTQSGGEACSLLIVNTFTSNGSPSITFGQSLSACQTAGIINTTPNNVRLTQ